MHVFTFTIEIENENTGDKREIERIIRIEEDFDTPIASLGDDAEDKAWEEAEDLLADGETIVDITLDSHTQE